MKNLVLALVLLSLTACGAYRFPGGSPPGTGTVSGTVMVYPCSPVEQQGGPCKNMPASGFELIFGNAAGASHTATTDSSGAYSITLDAGEWKVSVKGGIARIVSGPETVTVPAGGSVSADYIIDSGIRLPAASPVD